MWCPKRDGAVRAVRHSLPAVLVSTGLTLMVVRKDIPDLDPT